MRVKVRYFGQFRDITGKQDEILEVEKDITVIRIRELIREIYPKIRAKEDILVAVNGSFVPLDQVIKGSDEVALFPPVSGG
jgi:molybdopterin converting factor subunit 1